jgi:hypothetical protein
MRRLAGIALAGIVLRAGCACGGVGCGPPAIVDVTTTDISRLAGATMDVCWNDRCVNAAVPETLDERGALIELEQGAFRAEVLVDGVSATQASVSIWFWSIPDPNDGDVFSIDLATRDAQTIIVSKWTGSYGKTYPNGRCGDDGCLYAELTPR